MDATLKLKAEQLAGEIASKAQTLDDVNGLLRVLMKSALERMLDTEMDVHLGRAASAAAPRDQEPSAAKEPSGPANRRNGHSRKTVSGDLGELALDTPRDRHATFEPQLIPKHQRRLAGFDEKILALYAKGMTTRDIQEVVKELYSVEVSPALISQITADLDAEVTAWRQRRLDSVWPIVYLDGIVVHVRGDSGRVSQHTMYVAIGVNLQGKKELLGLWLSETEGAKFWLSCLTDLKNRGVSDIFVVCVDGLTGFADDPLQVVGAYLFDRLAEGFEFVGSQRVGGSLVGGKSDGRLLRYAACAVKGVQCVESFDKFEDFLRVNFKLNSLAAFQMRKGDRIHVFPFIRFFLPLVDEPPLYGLALVVDAVHKLRLEDQANAVG